MKRRKYIYIYAYNSRNVIYTTNSQNMIKAFIPQLLVYVYVCVCVYIYIYINYRYTNIY